MIDHVLSGGGAMIAMVVRVIRWMTGMIPARWCTKGDEREESASAPCAAAPAVSGFVRTRELGSFAWVEVSAEFGEPLYPLTLAMLQSGAGAKLLDLRAAKAIRPELFERLAHGWQVPASAVPRLGILLAYDSWAVLRDAAVRRLQPIAQRGIGVEIFYAQQLEHVPTWFQGGAVRHELPAVMTWLISEWRRATALWPSILSRTAVLVEEEAAAAAVPGLLIDLGVIALAFDGSDGIRHAVKHLHIALFWLGDTPSSQRPRALRALATAAQLTGDRQLARALLEKAVRVAAELADRIEGALALSELGLAAQARCQFGRAEQRFRAALAVLAYDEAPLLRALLHDQLMIAMHERQRCTAGRARRASAVQVLPPQPATRTP